MDDHALRFGRFRLDPLRRVPLHDGVAVRIGPRATSLLLVLVQRRRSVVSKAERIDLVWPDLVVEENNLQQPISALRKLFGPQAIVTVPGRGCMFALAPDGEPPTAGDPTPVPAAPVRAAHLPLLGVRGLQQRLDERLSVLGPAPVAGRCASRGCVQPCHGAMRC